MWWILLYLTTIPVCCVLVLWFLNKPFNEPLLGIYQQKNKTYWFKFVFMYVLLKVGQWITRARRAYAVETGTSCDGTIQVHREDEALEQKFVFGESKIAVDEVYFNGVSKEGAAVICGLARRHEKCDSFLYIKLNGKELLLSPELPDTQQIQTGTEIGDYKIKGLEIVNFIPMRTWKLTYNGEMKVRNNPEKTVKVDADLTWSALWAPFNYDFQMSPRCLANAIAREPWCRHYFRLLNKVRKTNYEQMGSLQGTVTVEGKEHPLRIPCVRHHTFGKFRDWYIMHRYVLHFIFLDNGDSIAVGAVSQPRVLSHLTVGYFCRKSDQTVLPVDSCDFLLYQHGENQVMPKEYSFMFRAGREQYTAQVKVEDEEMFFIGKPREAKFYERWASVEVNGLKGRACVEWHYNAVDIEDRIGRFRHGDNCWI